jgi:gliding motility-associated lipoprotein GldH
MKRHKFMVLLLIMTVFTACQKGVLFEEAHEIPVDGWSQDSYISFVVPVEDTVNPYQISLIIRNDARYEYSNLFLFINTSAPGGQTIRDTVEIKMADERGKWYGNGIGGKYTQMIPFKTDVVFPQGGNYLIEVEQGMREVELEHITDLGIVVQKMKR